MSECHFRTMETGIQPDWRAGGSSLPSLPFADLHAIGHVSSKALNSSLDEAIEIWIERLGQWRRRGLFFLAKTHRVPQMLVS